MPRTATRTTSRRAKAPTALDVLKQDHAVATRLFKQFERFHKNEDDDGMQKCAQAVCKALAIHAQIEEEIFYPALREAGEELKDPLDEADVEHEHIKTLVRDVENAKPGDELFEARMTVLIEYVRHHVEEEESTIFSKARKCGADLEVLGEQLTMRKQELGGEEAEAQAAEAIGSARAARSRNGQRASSR
jgi:hemerythrin superfamily protein